MTETAAPVARPGQPGLAEVELVIFDLDGVLIDVQQAEDGALALLAERMGLRLGRAEYTEMFSGRQLQACINLIEARTGSPAPADAVAFVRASCARLIGPVLEPVDGVREALAAIDVTTCVASNSPPEIIRDRLSAAGIDAHFGGRTYSAYTVNAWKPDPELFRWAATDLGADPARTIVIEDSAVGVIAARAAGMRAFQFCGSGAMPHPSATLTFDTMAALPGLIGVTA